MKRKTKVVKKHKIHNYPPKKYDSHYEKIAKTLIEKGLINKEVYEILGISEVTGIEWKKKYPKFKQAFIEGKKNRVERIKFAAVKSAVGFTIPSEEIVVVSDGKDMGSHWERVPVVKYYPPNPSMIKYYLNNRWKDEGKGKEEWAEKQSLEHSGSIETITPTKEQLKEIIDAIKSGRNT